MCLLLIDYACSSIIRLVTLQGCSSVFWIGPASAILLLPRPLLVIVIIKSLESYQKT